MLQGRASFLFRFCIPVILAFTLVMLCAPAVFAASSPAVVGPKHYYIAAGDSLAFGFQPDLDWAHGYSNYFYSNLKNHGEGDYDNYACPGETTSTFINGGCPYSYLKKEVYFGAQLPAVIDAIKDNAGNVSPVTLDIGANDLLGDIDTSNCTISAGWSTDLATVDTNLTKTILPQIDAALTVNGQRTGDLLLMGYYDPYQNICPNSVQYIEQINQHLQNDAQGFAIFVDVFDAFGGATTPNPNICNYTWMCSSFNDIHARDAGYSVMAGAFEKAAGY
jgi:lysophospholipase L1-like esterase